MRCTLGSHTPGGRWSAHALATGGASWGAAPPPCQARAPHSPAGSLHPWRPPLPHTHLFVQELPGILLDVAFIEVGGEAHEPHLGEAKIREFDVPHGGDKEAAEAHWGLRGEDRPPHSWPFCAWAPPTPKGQGRSDGEGQGSLVRLEVAVHDAIVMQVLQRQHCLSKVHAGHLHRQCPNVLQQGGTVPPWG